MDTFDSYEAAQAAADDSVDICGTYLAVRSEDGKVIEKEFGDPVYFLAPKTAGQHLMRLLSFEARYGEPHPDPSYLTYLEAEVRAERE